MTALLCALAGLTLAFFGLRYLYDRFWSHRLNCRICFSQEYAVEDAVSTLSEEIINDKLLPLPVLEVSFHMDRRLRFGGGENASLSDKTYRRDVFAAFVRQKITRTLDFQCAGRGYFTITEVGIAAQDLFLTRKYLTSVPQNTEFYVLPKPVPVAQIEIPFSRIMGAVLSRKRVCDDPFEFGGLREYAKGDPMKYINWKATARAGKLLSNLHDSTLSQRVVIGIDMESGGLQGDFLNEAGVRVACSLAERLLSAGIELSLYSSGIDVQTGQLWKLDSVSGTGSLLYMKKKLACLQSSPQVPDICSCMPHPSDSDDLLVLVSRNQRDELAQAFSAAVGKGLGVRVIPCGLGTSEDARKGAPVFSNITDIWMEF